MGSTTLFAREQTRGLWRPYTRLDATIHAYVGHQTGKTLYKIRVDAL